MDNSLNNILSHITISDEEQMQCESNIQIALKCQGVMEDTRRTMIAYDELGK